MNLEELVVTALINNTPLVIAFVAAGWWAFPHMLNKALSNGSGERIRMIIQEESLKQQDAHDERVEKLIHKALGEHQLKQDLDLQTLKFEVKTELIERTGEHNLRRLP